MSTRDRADRRSIVEAIDHAHDLDDSPEPERISEASGTPLESVQVLQDLGLADDAIATYLLRFNSWSVDD